VSPLELNILARDGAARRGQLRTRRGVVDTPAFMAVGTQGTVKGLTVEEVASTGTQVVLGNTYHLWLRPGPELVARAGGLHRFMDWPGAILTDSGGYQVFSLKAIRKIDDQGVTFRSHLDGSARRLDPEEAMRIQGLLGSDIAMALDECPASDLAPAAMRRSVDRTTAWALRSLSAPRIDAGQARFGIVQGGCDLDLRRSHAAQLTELRDPETGRGFDGFALGGLAVGEDAAMRDVVVEATARALPEDRPRYLMGVGTPRDLAAAVLAGVDMFDCVLPTRNARNGQLFTREGRLVISHAAHRESLLPVEEDCPCITCRRYTRAYLRHLYVAKEILYVRLATLHNLTFYQRVMASLRAAIAAGRLAEEASLWQRWDSDRKGGAD
jgi:queuine tRNA-ribosyltransferase